MNEPHSPSPHMQLIHGPLRPIQRLHRSIPEDEVELGVSRHQHAPHYRVSAQLDHDSAAFQGLNENGKGAAGIASPAHGSHENRKIYPPRGALSLPTKAKKGCYNELARTSMLKSIQTKSTLYTATMAGSVSESRGYLRRRGRTTYARGGPAGARTAAGIPGVKGLLGASKGASVGGEARSADWPRAWAALVFSNHANSRGTGFGVTAANLRDREARDMRDEMFILSFLSTDRAEGKSLPLVRTLVSQRVGWDETQETLC